jgi:hypothetical protein
MTQQALELPGLQVADTSDDWYTPRWIFDAAGITFDMDVCAPVDATRRTCPARRYLTPLEDGLTTPWEGTVWCNPPYSAPESWGRRWLSHGHGLLLVAWTQAMWVPDLMAWCDAFTTIGGLEFGRPDGSVGGLRYLFLLAGMGSSVDAVREIALRDRYARGLVLKSCHDRFL